jgi:hypothetical protein
MTDLDGKECTHADGSDIPRVVAFLDLLGFSELVSRNNFSAVLRLYFQQIRASVTGLSERLNYASFSDSLVIYTNELSYDAAKDLLISIADLCFNLLTKHQLAIRGSITTGPLSFYRNGNDFVVAGSPIVEAYRYESQQDWIGVIVTPRLIEKLPNLVGYSDFGNLRSPKVDLFKDQIHWKLSLQRCQSVPFKNSQQFIGLAIVPHSHTCNDSCHILDDLKEYHASLDSLLLIAPSPDAQQKYRNTMLFVEGVARLWDEVWKSDAFRKAMWVWEEEKTGTGVSRTLKRPDRLPDRSRLPDRVNVITGGASDE